MGILAESKLSLTQMVIMGLRLWTGSVLNMGVQLNPTSRVNPAAVPGTKSGLREGGRGHCPQYCVGLLASTDP